MLAAAALLLHFPPSLPQIWCHHIMMHEWRQMLLQLGGREACSFRQQPLLCKSNCEGAWHLAISPYRTPLEEMRKTLMTHQSLRRVIHVVELCSSWKNAA